MSEGAVQTRPAQSSSRHKAYRGLSEDILDDLVLDQDKSSAGRALRGDAGVALPVHLIEPIRDACRDALLEALRGLAQTNAAQSRMRDPECRKLCPHRTVNDSER